MVQREEANQLVFERLTRANPVLVDIATALDVVPGMQPNMVLTGGPLMPWSYYDGVSRLAILYATVYERLASSIEEADAKIRAGEIVVASAHDHSCAATNFAVCTASMPVLVVEERVSGRRGYSNMFEGDSPRRLGTGCYGEDVVERLRFVEQVLAPTIGEAVRRMGGLPVMAFVHRGQRLGDDMHIRTTASNLAFLEALKPAFRELGPEHAADAERTTAFIEAEKYSFFRVWLAAAKAISDGASGVEGSSIVTAMSMNARNFAIRVSGLGDQWFFGPHPKFEGRIRMGSDDNSRMVERFHGASDADDQGEWIHADIHKDTRYPGTDCMLTECLGLGAFASAGASALQTWHGVSTDVMVERNLLMYDLTWGEHPDFTIRRLGSRGSPIGIDIFKVIESGTTPMLNGIQIRNDGGIFGTGVIWTPIESYQAAALAYRERYGA